MTVRSNSPSSKGSHKLLSLALTFGFVGTLSQQAAAQSSATIFANNLVQEYDGTAKVPQFSTDPPNLSLSVGIFPQSQSETVFQSTPTVLAPSYESYGIEGTTDQGIGDTVTLAGTNRTLGSIDVTMVNWARANDHPVLATQNPDGYTHPISVAVYEVDGSDLTLLGQRTQEFFIPWRPATLNDGTPFPFNGIAFQARFDFVEEIELTETIAVIVSYNTENSGLSPIGTPGPYNSLNIGTSMDDPTVGSDANGATALRLVNGAVSESGAFAGRSPMFTVRALPDPLVAGTAIDAGSYLVRAIVDDPSFTGETSATLIITPTEAQITLSDLLQSADGTAKLPTIQTTPPGLNVNTVFANLPSPPTARGSYPFFVSIDSTNFVGEASGLLTLGFSFDSWINDRVTDGDIPASQNGRDDDPDGDGFSNFQEYAAGTNPGQIGERPPSLIADSTTNPQEKVIRFQRNNEAADVTITLERNLDLADGNAWSTINFPSTIAPGATGLQVIEVPFPVQAGEDDEYVRLGLSN